jgi:LPS O-antigen subunit length determinant protein (WzzB/FepE family)
MEDEATQLSRKELARQQRRAAYLRAKEYRVNDPKQLEFKEAMKLRRRELNETVKARRKAAMKEQKKRRSERQAERTAQAQQLTLLRPATGRE